MVRALLFVFFLTSSVCVAQTHDVLCTEGDGNFEAQFRTGIKVRVGAARNGTFATRSCAATLSWDKEELLRRLMSMDSAWTWVLACQWPPFK